MKRLICLILMFTLLCGCTPTGETQTTSPIETTLPIETTEPVPALLQNAVPWEGAEDLLEITLPFTEADQGSELSLDMLGENLLLWQTIYNEEGYTGAIQFWLVDVMTGALLAEYNQTVQGWGEFIQIQSDRLCILDHNRKTVTILDADLQLRQQWTLEQDWNQMFMGSGDTVYSLMESYLLEYDLNTGEERRLLEGVSGIYIGNVVPDGVTLSCYLMETERWSVTFLNFETGEFENPPFRGTFSNAWHQEAVWMCHRASDYGSLRVGNGDQAWDMMLPDGAMYLLNDGKLLHTNGRTLWLYTVSGEHLAECSLNSSIYYGGTSMPVWFESLGGYILEIYDQEESRTVVLFWAAEPENGENLNVTEVDLSLTEAQELARLAQRAAELGAQYEIEILVGTECETVFPDKTADLQTDPEVVKVHLDLLEQVLASFPEGFVQQLAYKDIVQDIRIHLVRNIWGVGDCADKDYGGFVQVEYDHGYFTMAINTDSADLKTYYHEFSHIIEDVVLADAMERTDALYYWEDWHNLNPEGFTYTYDKANYIELKPELEPYFIDFYALLNENEDRSRLFEYACTQGGNWIFAEKPGALEKLRYYAACIRDAFDTTGWPEVTVWEQYLQ